MKDIDLELYLNHIEKYDDKFSIKKKSLYRNKKRLTLKFNKRKINNLFTIWHKIPFSLLIYVTNLRNFHNMLNYFYALKDTIIIKKHRRIYKNNYLKKNITGFDCYRIYGKNFLELYDNIEEIVNYEINILGIEINNSLYSIEYIYTYFKTIKEDLKFFFNINNTFNKEFNEVFISFSEIDIEFNQNIQEIFIICQHIINLEGEKEQ